jgi:hypothetical protein
MKDAVAPPRLRNGRSDYLVVCCAIVNATGAGLGVGDFFLSWLVGWLGLGGLVQRAIQEDQLPVICWVGSNNRSRSRLLKDRCHMQQAVLRPTDGWISGGLWFVFGVVYWEQRERAAWRWGLPENSCRGNVRIRRWATFVEGSGDETGPSLVNLGLFVTARQLLDKQRLACLLRNWLGRGVWRGGLEIQTSRVE